MATINEELERNFVKGTCCRCGKPTCNCHECVKDKGGQKDICYPCYVRTKVAAILELR